MVFLIVRGQANLIDDSAAEFYRHHGFERVPSNAFRLVQKVSDIAAALQP